MNVESLKVLAVEDPAVMVYVDKTKGILEQLPYKVCMDVVPWDLYYPTMLEAFRGNAEYDVVMVAGHLWKREFIESGYLAEVEMEEDDLLPTIIKEIKYKEKKYLSPSFCDGHMIVYRKGIIKEVLGNLLPDMITPKTYVEVARRLKAYGYKIAMKAHTSEIFTDALPFLRMYGMDVYDVNSQKIQCDRPEIIQGLEEYCTLKSCAFEDTDTYGNYEVAEKLRSKEAAMGITWSGQMGVVYKDQCLDKEELGFATLSTAWNVTWSFGINEKSREKKLANHFLKYLRSAEIDRIAGAHSGAPVRESNYIKGKEKYPWYECQLKMLEHAVVLPDLEYAGEKNSFLYQEIANAFSGSKSAREAMGEAKRQIEKLEKQSFGG
ncbi:extracellular solute-binding protein [Lachnospiraceae bacterium LCP25S3_G4]